MCAFEGEEESSISGALVFNIDFPWNGTIASTTF